MFFRIKRSGNHNYLYREERYRADGKVKSRSVCLGRQGGSDAEYEKRQQRALASAERQAAQTDREQRAEFGETGAERATREAGQSKFSQPDFLAETAAPTSAENTSDNADSACAQDADMGSGEE
jgi:hypothetical protein